MTTKQNATIMVSKPILTKKHKSARLQFCRHNMQQNWNLVWYSDEKRFNLDGPHRANYYFHDLRKYPLIASKRQQGGVGTLVWGAFSTNKKYVNCVLQPRLSINSK